METIDLKIHYKIVENKLNTEIKYPSNFLDLADMQKVNLLAGLIDQFNAEAIPPELLANLPSLEEAHNDLVNEAAVLFPFSSTLSMFLPDSQEGQVSVEFNHEEKIGSLYKAHQMVLIDGIVMVLRAMAIMIVQKSEKKAVN